MRLCSYDKIKELYRIFNDVKDEKKLLQKSSQYVAYIYMYIYLIHK